jgi:hypothetical protein
MTEKYCPFLTSGVIGVGTSTERLKLRQCIGEHCMCWVFRTHTKIEFSQEKTVTIGMCGLVHR